jgi:hypothetical protein
VTRLAFPVFMTLSLAGSAAMAACPVAQPNSHQAKARPQADGCVDLGGVPQISANIVGAEPAPAVKAPTSPVAAPTASEGPTMGMAKPGVPRGSEGLTVGMPKQDVTSVPTIGYHWNLQ